MEVVLFYSNDLLTDAIDIEIDSKNSDEIIKCIQNIEIVLGIN